MKALRKWSRILHRDIGFFFIGTSIIYGLSGIALNHLKDFNPNYSVELMDIDTEIPLNKTENVKENILQLLSQIDDEDHYKQHYYPEPNVLKVFLDGGSSLMIDTDTGKGRGEFLRKRWLLYPANYLHYNPHTWWKWFSDIFAGALILFAITSLFMVRGKRGMRGTGGIYTVLGIIIPLLFLFYMLG